MPYGPNVKPQKDKELTKAERERKIEQVQAEQEERLRRALGDNLYDWLESFEQDMDVLPNDRLAESSDNRRFRAKA